MTNIARPERGISAGAPTKVRPANEYADGDLSRRSLSRTLAAHPFLLIAGINLCAMAACSSREAEPNDAPKGPCGPAEPRAGCAPESDASADAADSGKPIDVKRVRVSAADGSGNTDFVQLGSTTGTIVKLSLSYEISAYPISVAEYRACVESGACEIPDGDCEPLDADGGFEPKLAGERYTYDMKYWPAVAGFQ